mmetsp:Transcript_12454/g.28828  ORF Transcript_12454/g.28828 Transcript_12454/m.28828 type:complete len:151 (+) Transcript_12454:642-1094(+)
MDADKERGRPDAVVAQNLARAKEMNGLYQSADKDYELAISLTRNEIAPFWLRSALVKLQLGDTKGGMNVLKKVQERFSQASEVRAAYAALLVATGDRAAAKDAYLKIPESDRLQFADDSYLQSTVSWPPVAISALESVATEAGDRKVPST